MLSAKDKLIVRQSLPEATLQKLDALALEANQLGITEQKLAYLDWKTVQSLQPNRSPSLRIWEDMQRQLQRESEQRNLPIPVKLNDIIKAHLE